MKPLSENRKAHFDYQILETFEAGIALKGFEVKSIKSGKMNIAGSFVVPRATSKGSAELFLMNTDIPPYQPNNIPKDYDAKQSHRLLLTMKEINYLLGKVRAEGLTIVPLKVYTKNSLVKIEIALVKSKKGKDKREVIRKREVKRELGRTLKQ